MGVGVLSLAFCPKILYSFSLHSAGVRRPPALLCADRDISPELSSYEVALLEPLHDLKNLIARVFEELPDAAAEEPSLKQIIKEKLDILNGGLLCRVNSQHKLQIPDNIWRVDIVQLSFI